MGLWGIRVATSPWVHALLLAVHVIPRNKHFSGRITFPKSKSAAFWSFLFFTCKAKTTFLPLSLSWCQMFLRYLLFHNGFVYMVISNISLLSICLLAIFCVHSWCLQLLFSTQPTLPELVLVLDVGNSMLLHRSLGNKGREEEVENRESAGLDFKDKWIFFSSALCFSWTWHSPRHGALQHCLSLFQPELLFRK